MSDNATLVSGRCAPACSALISALRCVTDSAINIMLIPRAEVERILRDEAERILLEEAAIIEASREPDKTPNAEKSAEDKRP